MSWETISVRDLEDARHAELVDAVRRKALAVNQPDPLPKLIQDTIDEIRGCIGFKSAALLDSDVAKIARNLKPLAIDKIARRMVARIGRSLSDSERDEEKVYQRRLEDLKNGEWPVDAPDTATATETAAQPRRQVPSIAERDRTFSRGNQDGI